MTIFNLQFAIEGQVTARGLVTADQSQIENRKPQSFCSARRDHPAAKKPKVAMGLS